MFALRALALVSYIGVDGTWKVWDIRTFAPLHTFRYFGAPPTTMDASQSGAVMGIGFGPHVQFWKDVTSVAKPKMPYLAHQVPGAQIESLRFRPYEDFSYLGTTCGIQSVVVPGSGFANYHSHSADPYETVKVVAFVGSPAIKVFWGQRAVSKVLLTCFFNLKKSSFCWLIAVACCGFFEQQRQEREVHSLLEKLPADTITFDPTKLGFLDNAPPVVLCREEDIKRLKLAEDKKANRRLRSKAKGKASVANREKVF